MKLIALALTAWVAFSAAPPAFGAEGECKVTLAGLPTFTAKATATASAFENAATQCFELSEKRETRTHAGRTNDEIKLDIIDRCANLRCG